MGTFKSNVLLLILGAVGCLGEKISYHNHRVYSLFIQNDEQLNTLRNLEGLPNEYFFLDVPMNVNSKVQLVVPPSLQGDFDRLTRQLNIKHVLNTANLQSVIDSERPNRSKRAAFGWDDYYDLEEIYAWVDEIVQQYSNVLSVETIGQSYEGRDMKVIKLSYKEGNPGIFMDANIHAREWITSATVTWILNELLTSEDPAVRDLAENFDWYIVPVLNPDGFAYTHSTQRLWRKTRYPYTVLCSGADPNRNFDFNWSNGGTSTNPCSDVYAGAHPESEVEVKNVSNYIRANTAKFTMYLTIHSHGQYILLPFGYQDTPLPRPANYDHHMQIGQRAAVDMYRLYRKPYKVGTTAEALYIASGISVDWAYGAAGIPISYTFELRDQGEFGFILPADQIVPNAEEVLLAFIGMVDEARFLGYF